MSIKRIYNKPPWLLAVGIATILILSAAFFIQPLDANPQVACGRDWYLSTDPMVRDVCAKEKARKALEREDQMRQTALAAPYYQIVPDSKPPILLPQPEDTKTIKEVPLMSPNPEERQAPPPHHRGATSVWEIGSIPNATYTDWNPVELIAYGGNGTTKWVIPGTNRFTTNTDNPRLETSARAADGSRYILAWTCPKPVGKIFITKVVSGSIPGIGADGTKFAGLNYRIYFTTSAGPTGYFDMATQTWTFD